MILLENTPLQEKVTGGHLIAPTQQPLISRYLNFRNPEDPSSVKILNYFIEEWMPKTHNSEIGICGLPIHSEDETNGQYPIRFIINNNSIAQGYIFFDEKDIEIRTSLANEKDHPELPPEIVLAKAKSLDEYLEEFLIYANSPFTKETPEETPLPLNFYDQEYSLII